MPCLICRYYQPREPEQHKLDREAGRCEANCGNRWEQHTALHYVKAHGKLDGWCRLHPEPKLYPHNHVCGDVSVRAYFLNHNWRVTPFGPEDNIFEWAGKTLGVVLHGDNNWLERERAHAVEQNVELKRQLKAARKVSASRLKRLQKIDKKPISEPNTSEPEAPIEPFRPTLVAAE
jgi:hypothetical protein